MLLHLLCHLGRHYAPVGLRLLLLLLLLWRARRSVHHLHHRLLLSNVHVLLLL